MRGVRRIEGRCREGLLVLACTAAIATGPSAGAQGVADTGKAAPEAARPDWTKEAAAGYRIATADNPGVPSTLRPEPALHWTNPQRSTDDGASFLWLADGRPMAVACVYRFRRDGAVIEDHEFHSLATVPLVARKDGRVAWSPDLPGITPRPIPDAPAPAGQAAERLRQMRALAREFHAFLITEKDQTELRLLTQPLYRFEGDRPDGALFAFVQATDPEALLLIEAGDDGKGPVWKYSLARMSITILKVQHKGRDIWRVDWGFDPQVQDPRQPYFVLRDVGRTGR